MRCVACFLLLSFAVQCYSQSVGRPAGADEARRQLLVEADAVLVPAPATKAPTFQAAAWKTEKDIEPANATAWLNYYLWTSRDKALSSEAKQKTLSQTVAEAERHIGTSANYQLMLYLQSGKKDSASLLKALSLTSDKRLLLPYAVQQAVITQNSPALLRYATELATVAPLPAVLKEYHYNVLMSADSNAVIYAQGLNDLVPMALLQQVYNVRKDIRLKYFDGKPVRERSAYLCLSLGAGVIKQYANAAYTGLLVKVTGAPPEELARNIGRFDLRVLLSDDAVAVNGAPPVYKNYFPSFLLLYKQLRKKTDVAAAQWEGIIKRLAERTGDSEAVRKQMQN